MKIALLGYGKMGKTVEAVAKEHGHSISFIIDKDNLSDLSKLSRDNTDVVIEFSEPLSASDNVMACLTAGVNVVCGTTGWNIESGTIADLCKTNRSSFLQSSNFNIGTHLFFLLNRIMAEKSSELGYRVSIEEIHHVHKKDKPSGTAITLANEITGNSTLYNKWKPEGECEKNEKGVITINSIREGEITGIHTSKWESESDIIELTHNAKNRMGFASGALLAASFIQNRTGVFSMNDLLTEMFKI